MHSDMERRALLELSDMEQNNEISIKDCDTTQPKLPPEPQKPLTKSTSKTNLLGQSFGGSMLKRESSFGSVEDITSIKKSISNSNFADLTKPMTPTGGGGKQKTTPDNRTSSSIPKFSPSQNKSYVSIPDPSDTVESPSYISQCLPVFSSFTCMSIIAAIVLLLIIGYLLNGKNSLKCSGPPYLYMTAHDHPNILKYSRDGCLLTDRVLWGRMVDPEYRGMTLGTYNGKKVLYIVDSGDAGNALQIFGDCSTSGMRPHIISAVSNKNQPGAQHGYGITFDSAGNVLMSFQHTDVVLRFEKDSFRPFPSPVAKLENSTAKTPYFDSTFVQYGDPGVHLSAEQGVRMALWIPSIPVSDGTSSKIYSASISGTVWVANEDNDKVYIYNAETGALEHSIKLLNPIGLHLASSLGLVFVSSKLNKADEAARKQSGAVYAISLDTRTVTKTFAVIGMHHPTGIATFQDILFVMDQSQQAVHSFNITTGRYHRLIVSPDKLGDVGDLEQIIISPC